MTSGIYAIINSVNGKMYVGSSRDIEKRYKFHTKLLRNNKHINAKLQCAWNKHGELKFTCCTLEIVPDITLLLEYEQDWLDELNAVKFGYNIAVNTIGGPPSEEARRKLSIVHKGKVVSEETRKKQAEARIGKTLTEETKRKIGLTSIGRKHSEETKRKIGDAFRGKPLSEEHRKKNSIGHLGKVQTEETKRKISITNTGRRHSEETRAKLAQSAKNPNRYAKLIEYNRNKIWDEEARKKSSDARKGIFFSEEHKKNMSEARKHVVFSETHRKNISIAGKGRIITEETRKKMSEAAKLREAKRRSLRIVAEL